MRCHLPLRPAIHFALAMTLAGCAGSPGRLGVNLSAVKDCQKLATRVAVPEISADSDYRDVAAESLGAINRANRASEARTRCENKVVRDFGAAR